jgi:hypothetical protein
VDRPQRLARNQEKVTATLHGGRVTPGSGAGSLIKNDVTNDGWSFEVKTTQQKGYRLTLDTWMTTEHEALVHGKRPAMIISFWTAANRAKRLVVMDENDFIEMLQKVTEHGLEIETGGS